MLGWWYFSQQSWLQLVIHSARHFAWCTLHIDPGFNPSVKKIPCSRKWETTPVFLPGYPMHRGTWCATIRGVAKSQTRLSNSTHSAFKFNKQGDNKQPCRTPFLILSKSVVPCLILNVASWHTYMFFRRQVRWSGIPISLRIFQSVVIHTVKGFSVVNEAEADAFLELLCFLHHPTNVSSLISAFFASLKSSLWIWNFSVHILLKPSLKDFEHYLASMLNECSCTIVWTFFGIALLWHWNENWPFPVLWPLLSLPNLLAYWVQHFNSIIF